ncbi:hypothetical protein HKD37_09G025772 [Glycine soja]
MYGGWGQKELIENKADTSDCKEHVRSKSNKTLAKKGKENLGLGVDLGCFIEWQRGEFGAKIGINGVEGFSTKKMILTYNIRGLGGRLKVKFVKELERKKEGQFLFLQETKREVIDKELCFSLWEDMGQGFLGLERVWKERNRDAVIVNVYSPCDLEGKQRLWKDLLHHKASSTISKWCVVGDFNCITKIGKIIGENIYS